ncbi:MAG: sodium/glutamate symporter [Vicinamibacterales bacterium]
MQPPGPTTAPPLLTLDVVQTVALGGVALFLGYRIKKAIPALARYNIPAAVVGGMVVALLTLAAWARGVTLLGFETSIRQPLQIAFFTTIGFGASLSLLRIGGPLVAFFFMLSTIAAILQNVVGVGIARLLGEAPLLGVLAGSVTLTGGPATGLAFAPLFERAGVAGAETIAVAAAMMGIVAGGLIGGPIATALIKRHKLRTRRPSAIGAADVPGRAEAVVEAVAGEPAVPTPKGEDVEAYALLKNLVAIMVAMALGAWVSLWLNGASFTLPGIGTRQLTLPAYIGAMLVAAAIRNLDDVTKVIGLSQRTLDDLGTVSLALFIAVSLMTLQLWQLAGLALPLTIILLAQVALIVVLCLWPIYRLMGRDYDAAVISGGFCGFMLGTTANAMANMETLVERYGPSPKAFLIVPMVGAFFIDFTNAIIISFFLTLWGA